MTKRSVSNPLALAVLACLAERPMHPYEMASTMRERHKDDAIKLNYGSLYSVIETLCRHKFIVPKETIKDGRRPERTVFDLTAAGQHELHDWLSELISEPVKEFTQFEAGVSLLPVLSPEEGLRLLERRVRMLELGIAKSRSIVEYTRDKKIPRLFIVDREYHIALCEAELAWVRALIEDIKTNRLEGLDQWVGWHAPEATPSTV